MEDENLVAFAARTKDRVMQLKVEQTKLNDAKNRLQKILDLAKKESQVNNSKRRILLTTTNARNEVELEWNKVRSNSVATEAK